MPQQSSGLVGNIFLGTSQLEVHVAVDGHESAFVFDLTPLQANEDGLVDEFLQHGPRVYGYETHAGGCGREVGVRGERKGFRDSFDRSRCLWVKFARRLSWVVVGFTPAIYSLLGGFLPGTLEDTPIDSWSRRC